MTREEIRNLKVVVIGGGTGSFMLLSAMKPLTKYLTAIVSMADDGGSTGVLRDELGTLPPGDVRQCLVALSDTPKLRDLFDYRFSEGTFQGHSFGNLLLTALEKVTGDFAEAVETASEILRIHGSVVPATLDDVRLIMEWPEASMVLHGERVIDAEFFKLDPRRAHLSLTPEASVNPAALTAIEQADLILVAPGDLYTSLGPLLVIDGVGEALKHSTGLKVYISNLVSKHGQTDGFTVSDHAAEIERFAGQSFLDAVIYNDQQPSPEIAKRYADEGGIVTPADHDVLSTAHYHAVGAPLLGPVAAGHNNDVLPVTRSLIRHKESAVARAIMEAYEQHRTR